MASLHDPMPQTLDQFLAEVPDRAAFARRHQWNMPSDLWMFVEEIRALKEKVAVLERIIKAIDWIEHRDVGDA